MCVLDITEYSPHLFPQVDQERRKKKEERRMRLGTLLILVEKLVRADRRQVIAVITPYSARFVANQSISRQRIRKLFNIF